MFTANAIAAPQGVFKIVGPFVRNDVVIIFIGVAAFRAKDIEFSLPVVRGDDIASCIIFCG